MKPNKLSLRLGRKAAHAEKKMRSSILKVLACCIDSCG
jgi:hypothetical protein